MDAYWKTGHKNVSVDTTGYRSTITNMAMVGNVEVIFN
jgi:hypothetical protein